MDRYVGEQSRIIVISEAGSTVACCLCTVDVHTGRYYFSSLQSSLHKEHKYVYLLMLKSVLHEMVQTVVYHNKVESMYVSKLKRTDE